MIRRLLGKTTKTGLEAWFHHWLHAQNKGWRKHCSPQNCYFEFGVAGGKSMAKFARAALRFCRESGVDIRSIQIVGFDSFQGLPEKKSEANGHVIWKQGSFAHPREAALLRVAETGFPRENILFVEGFFESSLNPANFALVSKYTPAIVNVDVDYYSATREALAFIAPLLKSGAVFHFDDLWSFHGHPDMGQMKAIREFNGAHGYLTPCTERDYRGKTFIYSSLNWEYR